MAALLRGLRGLHAMRGGRGAHLCICPEALLLSLTERKPKLGGALHRIRLLSLFAQVSDLTLTNPLKAQLSLKLVGLLTALRRDAAAGLKLAARRERENLCCRRVVSYALSFFAGAGGSRSSRLARAFRSAATCETAAPPPEAHACTGSLQVSSSITQKPNRRRCCRDREGRRRGQQRLAAEKTKCRRVRGGGGSLRCWDGSGAKNCQTLSPSFRNATASRHLGNG